MNNQDFLTKLAESYKEYLNSHRRSNAKLKILHGAIAIDLQNRLGDGYVVKGYGVGDGKEGKIAGRYLNKQVDISIYKNGEELGGIAVKFVMTNYSQNSNNYFEDMLGETANIRSNNKVYCQIMILPEKMPYFTNSDVFSSQETVTSHNIEKYIKLSNDNPSTYMHTPDRNLIYLIKTPDISALLGSFRQEWIDNLNNMANFAVTTSETVFGFGAGVVYNDYEMYIDKVVHLFMSI